MLSMSEFGSWRRIMENNKRRRLNRKNSHSSLSVGFRKKQERTEHEGKIQQSFHHTRCLAFALLNSNLLVVVVEAWENIIENMSKYFTIDRIHLR